MTRATGVSVFRDTAILSLSASLARYEDESVPASVIGTVIAHMSRWDAADLCRVVQALKDTGERCGFLEDTASMLQYAPRRRFASVQEVTEWCVSAASIREAVELAAFWGFVPRLSQTKPQSSWNAFLLTGLCILAQQEAGMVRRERVFTLLSVLGLARSEALRAIAVQKQMMHE